MPLYDYPRDKNPDSELSPYMRRPFGPTDPTVAMHWDGTYRDHDAYSNGFWSESDYQKFGHPIAARLFAKHLAE